MKKLNNKGFAISTLLYGLLLVAFMVVALLMSVMSTNRKNTSTLVKKIEEELNRYSETATEITSTDGAQEFIVPFGKSGWYKIELWGAAAYNAPAEVDEDSTRRGAYTSGIIYLNENQHLYFQIGTIGVKTAFEHRNNVASLRNGGATDVRLDGGTWQSFWGSGKRIMVAAGGGYDSFNGVPGGYGGYYTYSYKDDSEIVNDGGSYISGYAGQSKYNGDGDYYFLNPIMYSGVNAGAGKARIELISTNTRDNPPAKKTNRLNGIRFIKDCITVPDTQPTEFWREIQVINSNGDNVARSANVYYGDKNSQTTQISSFNDGKLDVVTTTQTSNLITETNKIVCIKVDLRNWYSNLEEIVIFHNKPKDSSETTTYSHEEVYVSDSEQDLDQYYVEPIISWGPTKAPTETYMGLRISDRHPYKNGDYDSVATTNYYIQSALSDNRVLTIEEGGIATLSLFTGDKTQKFSISRSLSYNEMYNVLNTSGLALQPNSTSMNNSFTLNTPKNNYDGDECYIFPIGNGISGNGYQQLAYPAGCLAVSENERDKSGQIIFKECDTTDKSQWFKFVNATY